MSKWVLLLVILTEFCIDKDYCDRFEVTEAAAALGWSARILNVIIPRLICPHHTNITSCNVLLSIPICDMHTQIQVDETELSWAAEKYPYEQ